jgi:hypothetical protein
MSKLKSNYLVVERGNKEAGKSGERGPNCGSDGSRGLVFWTDVNMG